jgi:hypothetical protein
MELRPLTEWSEWTPVTPTPDGGFSASVGAAVPPGHTADLEVQLSETGGVESRYRVRPSSGLRALWLRWRYRISCYLSPPVGH